MIQMIWAALLSLRIDENHGQLAWGGGTEGVIRNEIVW